MPSPMISVCTAAMTALNGAQRRHLVPVLTRTGSGHATTLRFSRKGDYLASGRVDGKVVIW